MRARTEEYSHELLGCRFCPMCKPASDSLNATYLESDAARAHAMIIWRAMKGIKDYSEKDAEILYRCNLDSVSEAYCVDHYRMSEIMLAARRDIVDAGKVPAQVQNILNRDAEIVIHSSGDTLLFAEGYEINKDKADEIGEKLARRLNCGWSYGTNGYLPYVLGDSKAAEKEARAFADAVAEAGVKTLITTGPESLLTFTKIYNELGIELSAKVESLSKVLVEQPVDNLKDKKVFVHDARAAYYLSDTKPDEKIIMPDFFGPEDMLGTGEVYELSRKRVADTGAELLFSVWSRGTANAMGNDEGVSVTYPAMAEKMAKRRLRMIRELGTQILLTDSLATFLYIKSLPEEYSEGMETMYLGTI